MQCPHCFREVNTSGPCPYCGYDPAPTAGKYPLALKAGSILNGRYILGHVLGQGGFGVTYIAWDDSMKERVAIKEYLPGDFANRSAGSPSVQVYSGDRAENFAYGKAQFLEEAKTLAAFIGCPGIVRIYSYFEENGTAYLSMEYVDGLPLDKYMASKGGRLMPAEANRLLVPLMESLETVHEKGIVHRDIAPDNILVTKDGTAKLIDFGAARYSTGEKSKSLDVILKHGFAPYEQYMRRGRQGPWTDVYALAATYYYAVTGKVPAEAVERVQEDILIPPSALGVKLGKIEDVLLHAMEVFSNERYQSMGEFRRAMLEAAGETAAPVRVPPEAPPAPVSESAPAAKNPPAKKSKLPLILGAVAVVAAVAVFALLPGKGAQQAAAPAPAPVETPTPTPTPDPRVQQYAEAEAYLQEGVPHKAWAAFHELGDYQDAQARADQIAHDMRVKNSKPIAAGYCITVGLKTDGTVVTAGTASGGQRDVSDWNNIVSVETCDWMDFPSYIGFTIGLKKDGTVVAAGDNECGQCNVSDWRDIVAISADGGRVFIYDIYSTYTPARHTVGLKADGTVVAAGSNDYGECAVSDWTDIVAVAAGHAFTVGLKEDGTVVATGDNSYGQCNVSDWTDIVAISANSSSTAGLSADGSVVITGENQSGKNIISSWTNIEKISAGSYHLVALKADGSVVSARWNKYAEKQDISHWKDIIAIASGSSHTVGLKSDGTVVAVGDNNAGQCNVSTWRDIAPAK